MNTRKKDGQAPISYDVASRLLTRYPEADEGIALPAIPLHEPEGIRDAEEIMKHIGYEKEKPRK